MSSLADLYDEHIRLAILRLLDGASGYCANDSVLTQGVQQLGLTCTRDQIRSQLTWLQEVRLLTLLRPADNLIVATLGERGADIANGRSTHPGITRPSPKG